PYCRPLHAMGLAEIPHSDTAARLTAIPRKPSAPTAAAARRAVSAFFRWTMEEGWASANPVVGTRKPAGPQPRDRVLSDNELAAIWNACGDDDHGRIVRLLVLLGSRRSEIGGMRRGEFELNAGTWTLPAERSKNHRAHTLTLPPTALKIVHAASDLGCGDRDHLFGARAACGFTAWAHSKAALDQRLTGAAKPWRLHDIRRSVATKMADIGIEPHVIEAVLNHFSGHRAGLAGVYNRSGYDRAVKAALLRWSKHVLALVEGRGESNVIPLHA